MKYESIASFERERQKTGMPKRGPAIHDDGVYVRRCPACSARFRTNLESKVYCDRDCQDKAYKRRKQARPQ